MQAPEDIEAILHRLMPTALSGSAQEEMEAIFGEEKVPRKNLLHYTLPPAIAAAAAFAFFLMPEIPGKAPQAVEAPMPPELTLIGATDRIESMTDEGLQSTSTGEALHAVRLRVVEENTVQDQETGITMMVSEPREELILVPIAAF